MVPTGGVCHGQQALFDVDVCQRWWQRRPSWRRRSEGGFDARRYRVVAVDETPARGFVEQHHYARSWPSATLRYGLIEVDADELVGVAVLGVPMRREVLTLALPGLRPYEQSLECSRLVLLDRVPANAESWFMARVLAHAAGLGVLGVVAFSDPVPRRTVGGELVMPGHWGCVYQALGAVYTGRGTRRMVTLLPDGTVLSDRAAQKIRNGERGHLGVAARLAELGPALPPLPAGRAPGAGWLREALASIGARRVRHPGNHRYVWGPTGLASLPYPKAVDTALPVG